VFSGLHVRPQRKRDPWRPVVLTLFLSGGQELLHGTLSAAALPAPPPRPMDQSACSEGICVAIDQVCRAALFRTCSYPR
jgi:hypothetical protein